MLAKYLKIEFSDKKSQKYAKQAGFSWNPNLKLWTPRIGDSIEIPEHYWIFDKIVDGKSSTTKEMTYSDAYNRYGFDFAEEGNWK